MNFKLDIILCILVLPGMMFLFPLAEWSQWHPGFVLVCVAWLYAVYFLCSKLLGPMILRGSRWMAAGVLFLMATVTFLMTILPADYPSEEVGPRLYVRAMWILFLAVTAISLPCGYLSAKVKEMEAVRDQEQALSDAKAILGRGTEALSDAKITLKSGYKTVHVPLAAIQYAESRNNYTCIHLDNSEDVVSQLPLKNLLDMLPEGKFVRVHRSYAVPLWRIEHSSATEVRLTGVETSIPVGRAYKDTWQKAFTQQGPLSGGK